MDVYDADELGRYRSLSSLAVCALVLSLFSMMSLLVPLLAIIPLAGIAVALLALKRIAATENTLSGTGVARFALFLSLACLVAVPMRLYVRDTLYKTQADQFARHWLELLGTGKGVEALNQLSNDAMTRFARSDNPDAPPSRIEPEVAAAQLLQDPLVTKFSKLATQRPPSLETLSADCSSNNGIPRVILTYRLGDSDQVPLVVSAMRVDRADQVSRWLIDSWKLPDEATHTY